MSYKLNDNWTLLTKLSNEMEAGILKAFFDSYDMPVIFVNKKDHAYPIFGKVEVFVPLQSINTAQALLTLFTNNE